MYYWRYYLHGIYKRSAAFGTLLDAYRDACKHTEIQYLFNLEYYWFDKREDWRWTKLTYHEVIKLALGEGDVDCI